MKAHLRQLPLFYLCFFNIKNMTYYEQLQSPFWQRKRLEIMQRDKFTCQFCGAKEKTLTVHHLCYISKLSIWDYDNELMITLCKSCHEEIHEYNKIFALLAKSVMKHKIDIFELHDIICKFHKFD